MARERTQLVWGMILLFGGALWLLLTLGLGRLIWASFAGAYLAAIGGIFLRGYLREPDRRPGFLLGAAGFFGLAAVTFLGILRRESDWAVGLFLFGALSAASALVHRRDPGRTWALVSSWVFGLLGAVIVLDSLGVLGGRLAGPALLFGSGIPALLHFLRSGREKALIPAGLLFTCGLVSLLDELGLGDRWQVTTFLLGGAVTFAAVHVLGPPARGRWAQITSLLCAALAALTALSRPMLVYGIPLALIALGAFLLAQSFRSGPVGDGPPPPARVPGRAGPARRRYGPTGTSWKQATGVPRVSRSHGAFQSSGFP